MIKKKTARTLLLGLTTMYALSGCRHRTLWHLLQVAKMIQLALLHPLQRQQV